MSITVMVSLVIGASSSPVGYYLILSSGFVDFEDLTAPRRPSPCVRRVFCERLKRT